MGWIRPIPVAKEDIKIGNRYYTCEYSGSISVTAIKIFYDKNSVLVKAKDNKRNPFVRSMNYIFDNLGMARSACRNWEHDERKRKRKRKKGK